MQKESNDFPRQKVGVRSRHAPWFRDLHLLPSDLTWYYYCSTNAGAAGLLRVYRTIGMASQFEQCCRHRVAPNAYDVEDTTLQDPATWVDTSSHEYVSLIERTNEKVDGYRYRSPIRFGRCGVLLSTICQRHHPFRYFHSTRSGSRMGGMSIETTIRTQQLNSYFRNAFLDGSRK
jgi:hypothetical protein